MKVIAGKYRGKKLKEFDIPTTRPTRDRIKESMFDIIQFKISDAVVLDLFTGTGGLGIEALSRGAKYVDFVDTNPEAIKLINFNLRGVEGNYKVNNCQHLQFLQTNKQKYDIVLLDPPFASFYGEEAVEYILKNNLLNTGGLIVLEVQKDRQLEIKILPTDIQTKIKQMQRKDKIQFSINGKTYQITLRKYGVSAVYIIENL